MKTSATSFIIGIAILSSLTSFNSCKKGENDPFLSLRSRTARVSGEWTVNNRAIQTTTTIVDFLGNTTVTSNSEVFSGGILTDSSVTAGITNIDKTDYSLNYTFNKEGAYTSSSTEIDTKKDTVKFWDAQAQNDADYLRTTVVTISEDENGTWNFLSNVGAVKNKESINVSQKGKKIKTVVDVSYVAITAGAPAKEMVSDTTSSSSTCSMCVEVWKITQLRNKEMIVEGEINNSSSNISSTFSTSTETVGTFSMILVQD